MIREERSGNLNSNGSRAQDSNSILAANLVIESQFKCDDEPYGPYSSRHLFVFTSYDIFVVFLSISGIIACVGNFNIYMSSFFAVNLVLALFMRWVDNLTIRKGILCLVIVGFSFLASIDLGFYNGSLNHFWFVPLLFILTGLRISILFRLLMTVVTLHFALFAFSPTNKRFEDIKVFWILVDVSLLIVNVLTGSSIYSLFLTLEQTSWALKKHPLECLECLPMLHGLEIKAFSNLPLGLILFKGNQLSEEQHLFFLLRLAQHTTYRDVLLKLMRLSPRDFSASGSMGHPIPFCGINTKEHGCRVNNRSASLNCKETQTSCFTRFSNSRAAPKKNEEQPSGPSEALKRCSNAGSKPKHRRRFQGSDLMDNNVSSVMSFSNESTRKMSFSSLAGTTEQMCYSLFREQVSWNVKQDSLEPLAQRNYLKSSIMQLLIENHPNSQLSLDLLSRKSSGPACRKKINAALRAMELEENAKPSECKCPYLDSPSLLVKNMVVSLWRSNDTRQQADLPRNCEKVLEESSFYSDAKPCYSKRPLNPWNTEKPTRETQKSTLRSFQNLPSIGRPKSNILSRCGTSSLDIHGDINNLGDSFYAAKIKVFKPLIVLSKFIGTSILLPIEYLSSKIRVCIKPHKPGTDFSNFPEAFGQSIDPGNRFLNSLDLNSESVPKPKSFAPQECGSSSCDSFSIDESLYSRSVSRLNESLGNEKEKERDQEVPSLTMASYLLNLSESSEESEQLLHLGKLLFNDEESRKNTLASTKLLEVIFRQMVSFERCVRKDNMVFSKATASYRSNRQEPSFLARKGKRATRKSRRKKESSGCSLPGHKLSKHMASNKSKVALFVQIIRGWMQRFIDFKLISPVKALTSSYPPTTLFGSFIDEKIERWYIAWSSYIGILVTLQLKKNHYFISALQTFLSLASLALEFLAFNQSQFPNAELQSALMKTFLVRLAGILAGFSLVLVLLHKNRLVYLYLPALFHKIKIREALVGLLSSTLASINYFWSYQATLHMTPMSLSQEFCFLVSYSINECSLYVGLVCLPLICLFCERSILYIVVFESLLFFLVLPLMTQAITSPLLTEKTQGIQRNMLPFQKAFFPGYTGLFKRIFPVLVLQYVITKGIQETLRKLFVESTLIYLLYLDSMAPSALNDEYSHRSYDGE